MHRLVVQANVASLYYVKNPILIGT